MSFRPEWGTKFKIQKKSSNSFRIWSEVPSNLDRASRDIKFIRPEIYAILGANNSERFFLERSNVRIENDLDPYPFGPYDEQLDGPILRGLDNVSHSDRQSIQDILNQERNVKSGKNIIVLDASSLSYGAIQVARTAAVDRLLERPFIHPCDVLTVYGRYLSINGGSNAQYTHTPKVIADYLHARWDVQYEGFSSPFNAMHSIFSSMYFEIDCLFGSVGPFGPESIVRFQDHNQSINPPFTHYFYKLTKESIEKAFPQVERKDLLVFCKQPNWYDEPSIEWFKDMDKNPYLVAFAVIPIGQFFFERLNGDLLVKLTGGLLFSVLSPLGQKHPTFGPDQLKEITDFYRDTSPAMKYELDTRPYIDMYSFKVFLKNGESLESILEKIDSGQYTSKMTREEMIKLAQVLETK